MLFEQSCPFIDETLYSCNRRVLIHRRQWNSIFPPRLIQLMFTSQVYLQFVLQMIFFIEDNKGTLNLFFGHHSSNVRTNTFSGMPADVYSIFYFRPTDCTKKAWEKFANLRINRPWPYHTKVIEADSGQSQESVSRLGKPLSCVTFYNVYARISSIIHTLY